MTRLPQFRGGKSGSVVRLRPCFSISFVSSLVISDREREGKREKERGLEKVGGAVITGQSDS